MQRDNIRVQAPEREMQLVAECAKEDKIKAQEFIKPCLCSIMYNGRMFQNSNAYLIVFVKAVHIFMSLIAHHFDCSWCLYSMLCVLNQ